MQLHWRVLKEWQSLTCVLRGLLLLPDSRGTEWNQEYNIRETVAIIHTVVMMAWKNVSCGDRDRWAPGLDSWCLSSGLKLKLCSHPAAPRTKLEAEAELCWSKEIRWPLLRSRKTSLSAHAQEVSLRVKKKGAPPHNKCGRAPTGLWGGIHLSKRLHTHVGEGPGTSWVWKKKQDNWPKVNKDPEGLSYISNLNHVFTVLLLIREDDRTLSFWVCISALLLSLINKLLLCVLCL